ncbi:MAG: gluconate 2-dehydrogenase subunit 3 family protein [Pseudomonadota bacterium]
MSAPDVTAESPVLLERRELLKRAAWLLGGAVSAPAALAILQGCSAKEGGGAPVATKILTAAQLALVAEIAEIMIPKTTTSGAKDAGVPVFIDSVLDAVYPKDAQDRFTAGLKEFDAAAKSSGKAFLEREPAERVAFVKQSLEAALAGERDPKPFILMTRELTLLGFFTSQVGISENMDYVPVPTVFHGCVPLTQMKKHVYWE